MIPKGDDRCPGWGHSLSDLGQYRLSRMPEGTEPENSKIFTVFFFLLTMRCCKLSQNLQLNYSEKYISCNLHHLQLLTIINGMAEPRGQYFSGYFVY